LNPLPAACRPKPPFQPVDAQELSRTGLPEIRARLATTENPAVKQKGRAGPTSRAGSRVTQTVKNRRKPSEKSPVKQGLEEAIAEPNKIGGGQYI